MAIPLSRSHLWNMLLPLSRKLPPAELRIHSTHSFTPARTRLCFYRVVLHKHERAIVRLEAPPTRFTLAWASDGTGLDKHRFPEQALALCSTLVNRARTVTGRC